MSQICLKHQVSLDRFRLLQGTGISDSHAPPGTVHELHDTLIQGLRDPDSHLALAGWMLDRHLQRYFPCTPLPQRNQSELSLSFQLKVSL